MHQSEEILKLFSAHGELTMEPSASTGEAKAANFSEAIVSVGEEKFHLELDPYHGLVSVAKQLMDYLKENLPANFIQLAISARGVVNIVKR